MRAPGPRVPRSASAAPPRRQADAAPVRPETGPAVLPGIRPGASGPGAPETGRGRVGEGTGGEGMGRGGSRCASQIPLQSHFDPTDASRHGARRHRCYPANVRPPRPALRSRLQRPTGDVRARHALPPVAHPCVPPVPARPFTRQPNTHRTRARRRAGGGRACRSPRTWQRPDGHRQTASHRSSILHCRHTTSPRSRAKTAASGTTVSRTRAAESTPGIPAPGCVPPPLK